MFEGIPNVIERPTQVIFGIWIEIVHNLKGSLDNIKGNMQAAELKLLEFHAIWDKEIYFSQIFYKVEYIR